jgi:peptidoglycan hydrolase CwlO-like protein
MELIQIHKNKIATNSIHTSLRQSVLTFINRNADVFEALTRSAYPFGSSWRSPNRNATSPKAIRRADDQLAQVQQQVDELTRMIAQLSNQIRSIQPVQSPAGTQANQSAVTHRPTTLPSDVGINRFRTLKANTLVNN